VIIPQILQIAWRQISATCSNGQLGVTWGIVQLGTLTSSSVRFGTNDTSGGSVDSGFNGCTITEI
jgi:hypothetical protein